MGLRGLVALTLLVLAWLAPSALAAQDCDCDHRIEPDMLSVNGEELGVQPGDRVCVMAGEREFLRLQAFRGSEAEPVVVTNCGGQVVIHNDDRAYALVVEDSSQYFRITGTGDPAVEYGFLISAPAREPYPGVGLWLLGKSSDYEVDHMEIFDTGFAGVSAKTDPLCDGSADEGNFVQRNSHIHHLYVHDTGGEGFYIGSTQVDGQTITCDGNQETHFPHFLEGLEVHDNIIENTGWDGAQIGMTRSGCRFYRNVIRNVGLEGVQYQQQGLQVGTWTSCEIFANVFETGPTNGIFILGSGSVRAYNNVVRGFENHCIYANDSDRVPGASYEFLFNSLENCTESGLTVFGNDTVGNRAINNLVIASDPAIAAGGDVDWTESNNLVFGDLGAAGVDDQLIPSETSAVLGAGMAIADIAMDLRGVDRPDPPAVGAYEYLPPDVDPPDGGFNPGPAPDLGSPGDDMGTSSPPNNDTPVADMGGMDSGGPGAATHEASGGCCATTGGARQPWWLALALAVVALRTRTRRTCKGAVPGVPRRLGRFAPESATSPAIELEPPQAI